MLSQLRVSFGTARRAVVVLASLATVACLLGGVGCSGQTLPDYHPGRSRALATGGADEPLDRRRPLGDDPDWARRERLDPEADRGGPRADLRLDPRGERIGPAPVPARPAAEVVRPDPVAEAAVRNALQRRIPMIIWPGIAWSDAIGFFQGDPDLGLNIVPVWPALKNEGIPPDRAVTLRAENLTVAEALDRLMELVGTGHTPASRPVWYIRGNVVVITTAARRAEEAAIRLEP